MFHFTRESCHCSLLLIMFSFSLFNVYLILITTLVNSVCTQAIQDVSLLPLYLVCSTPVICIRDVSLLLLYLVCLIPVICIQYDKMCLYYHSIWSVRHQLYVYSMIRCVSTTTLSGLFDTSYMYTVCLLPLYLVCSTPVICIQYDKMCLYYHSIWSVRHQLYVYSMIRCVFTTTLSGLFDTSSMIRCVVSCLCLYYHSIWSN